MTVSQRNPWVCLSSPKRILKGRICVGFRFVVSFGHGRKLNKYLSLWWKNESWSSWVFEAKLGQGPPGDLKWHLRNLKPEIGLTFRALREAKFWRRGRRSYSTHLCSLGEKKNWTEISKRTFPPPKFALSSPWCVLDWGWSQRPQRCQSHGSSLKKLQWNYWWHKEFQCAHDCRKQFVGIFAL